MSEAPNLDLFVQQLCRLKPTHLNIDHAILALKRAHTIEENKYEQLAPRLLTRPFQISKLPTIKAQFESVFGEDRTLHPFRHDYDWAMKFTEPAVTRSLVKLIDHRLPAIKNARLAALLCALSCRDVPEDLSNAIIKSENDRIDILIGLPLPSDSQPKFRPIIIEAKFDYNVQEDQLEKYSRKIANDPIFDHKQADRILILKTEADYHNSTDGHSWRYVLWRDLWIEFEKHRLSNDPDISIALFMNGLWKRIGAKKA